MICGVKVTTATILITFEKKRKFRILRDNLNTAVKLLLLYHFSFNNLTS